MSRTMFVAARGALLEPCGQVKGAYSLHIYRTVLSKLVRASQHIWSKKQDRSKLENVSEFARNCSMYSLLWYTVLAGSWNLLFL